MQQQTQTQTLTLNEISYQVLQVYNTVDELVQAVSATAASMPTHAQGLQALAQQLQQARHQLDNAAITAASVMHFSDDEL